MVSLTFNIDDDTLKIMNNFNWVSWSELARQEIRKKLIFEKYMQTKKISQEDMQFCNANDWHPVDELPLKASFINKIKSSEKKYKKLSIKELDKAMDLKNV
jgi:hypothetical protein